MKKGHIKNWTVTSESIKEKAGGLIGYIHYLNNPDHPHHKETEIKNIFKAETQENKFIKKCCAEALELDLKNANAKKGGRPVDSFAVSFDFVLPPNTVRPTVEQWKEIAKDIFKTAKNGLEGNLTQEHIYMNIHDQEKPHLNFVVSKVIDGKRERKVDQKAFLHSLKLQFNESVLKHCDLDYKDYVPDNVALGKRKKRWQYELDQIKKAHKQFESLINYSNENNQKRINSTKNRIIKTLSTISENNQNEFLDQASEVQDPSLVKALEEIRKGVENGQDSSTGQKKNNTSKSRNRLG